MADIVYNRRYATLQNYDLAFIGYLEGMGFVVDNVADGELDLYDYTGVKLLILGPPGSTWVENHPKKTFLSTVPINCLSLCRGVSRNAFSMGTGTGATNISAFSVIDNTHPITENLSGTITIGPKVSTQGIGTLTIGTNLIMKSDSTDTSTGITGIAERIYAKNDVDYSRIHFAYHQADELNNDGWDLFERTIKYLTGWSADYKPSGTYTITIPTTDLPDNVYLRYIVDTPDDTDIVAKYALSDSSDDNIESWIIANDGDIIGLDKNYLWVQFTLSTDDETVTPTIEALWLEEKDDKTVNMVEIDTGEIYLRNIGNGEEFDTLIDIGTSSTTTSNWAPYRVYYYKNKVQFIILASELEAKGITSGTIIDALSFKVSSKPSRNLNNFRIRIKETKDTTVTAWHTTDLTLAHYSQSIDHSLLTVGTVYKHEFNADITEWRYRGDNLLIEVSRDDTSGTNSGGMYLRTGLVANRMLTWNADSGASFPFDSVSGTAQSSVLETTISCINVEYADMGTYILVTSTASIPDLAPRLRFSTDEPDSTNINAEYACTDTNETEPDTWMAVDNEDILNLNNDYVWLRFTLETEDKTVTPILKSVWLEQANAPPDTIVLYFDSHNRFHDAEGKITVAYNQSLGSLSGERPVESFSEQFDPLDLEPTPIVSHTLTAGVDVSVDFIPLEYINGYTKSHTITAGVVKVEVEVIPLDMVDP